MASVLKNRSKTKKEGDQLLSREVGSAEQTPENEAAAEGPKPEDSTAPLRYGQMPTFSGQRLWSRSALILGLMIIVYYNSTNVKESSFGKFDETIQGRAFDTKCSDDYVNELKSYKGCQPEKCGRIIADTMDGSQEVLLSNLAKRIFIHGKKNSGIYDLFTGKLLHDQETDLFASNTDSTNVNFEIRDKEHVESTTLALHHMISQHFQIDSSKIKLNAALYIRLTPSGKKKRHLTQHIVHQESFSSHFSAIIYLTSFGKDFTGGRLVFQDSDFTNRTIEGRKGRVLAFTSGQDNRYTVEPVTKGELITLVLGFTCNTKEKFGSLKFPKPPSEEL